MIMLVVVACYVIGGRGRRPLLLKVLADRDASMLV